MSKPTRIFLGPLRAADFARVDAESADLLPMWQRQTWQFVRSGTAALRLLLRGLMLPRGSRVLSSAFVCDDIRIAAEAESLSVVYGDVRPTDWHLAFMPDVWTRIRPAAIVLPHLYGMVHPDLEPIQAWAQAAGIPLLHDAAHCYGLQAQGQAIINLDAGGFYSFGVGKSATAAGGALVRGVRPELVAKLELDTQKSNSRYAVHILRERAGVDSWTHWNRLKYWGLRGAQLQVQAARVVVARLDTIEQERKIQWQRLCANFGPDWLADVPRQSYYKYLCLAESPIPEVKLASEVWRVARRESRSDGCPVYNNLRGQLYEFSTEYPAQEPRAARD